MKKVVFPLSTALMMSACSVMPDVTYRYYPAKLETTVTAIQTIDCSAGVPLISTAVTPSNNYSADRTQDPREIRITSMDSPLADNTFGIKLSDDGRLKNINTDSTGQGEAILKSAISMGTALAPLGITAAAEDPACAKMKATVSAMSATIKYTTVLDYKQKPAKGGEILAPTAETRTAYAKLRPIFPSIDLKLRTTKRTLLEPPATYDGDMTEMIHVDLNQVANVHLAMTGGGLSTPIWEGDVSVPTPHVYTLPVPKSALFGGQKFALALSDAGTITEISYNKTTGLAGAANVITAGANAAKPKSPADVAAELKAEADTIAQQTRLTRCRIDPSKCI